uniref:SHSP domain-containing protein n=1 Tax=Macrostomum lignano TaxID=282301 RepID=A0A1I8JHJ0_9PLAT
LRSSSSLLRWAPLSLPLQFETRHRFFPDPADLLLVLRLHGDASLFLDHLHLLQAELHVLAAVAVVSQSEQLLQVRVSKQLFNPMIECDCRCAIAEQLSLETPAQAAEVHVQVGGERLRQSGCEQSLRELGKEWEARRRVAGEAEPPRPV